jgi:sugar/nucleoside kinase (ribokinase family)
VDLLTVGEAFEDFIFAGLSNMPRPGEELRVPHFTVTAGGGALITAVAAARLGLRTGVLTAVAEDGARRLARERVSTLNLLRRGERHALTVALSTERDRAFVTFDGVNRLLGPRLLSSLRRLPRVPRHIHFALSPTDCATWIPVVARFRAAGTTTSWDFGWDERLLRDRGFRRLAASVDWLLLNEHEASLYAKARSLAEAKCAWEARGSNTVIKIGPRGAFAIADGKRLSRPATRARVVDTTGAGDAFNAGFLAAILGGASVDAALRLGNYVGARSTETLGGLDGLPRRAVLPRWAHTALEVA